MQGPMTRKDRIAPKLATIPSLGRKKSWRACALLLNSQVFPFRHAMAAAGAGAETLPCSVLPTQAGTKKRQRWRRGAGKEGNIKRRAGRLGCTRVSRNYDDNENDGGSALVSSAARTKGAGLPAASNCDVGPRRSVTTSQASRCQLVVVCRQSPPQ